MIILEVIAVILLIIFWYIDNFKKNEHREH